MKDIFPMQENNEFTYAIVTYKHRKYIIDHLFSIKYQIIHYGLKWKNYLLVVDDASQDGTVEAIQCWLKENNIFSGIEIIENKKNMGTVHNFIEINKQVKTRFFKILAGDDIYYKNDIYEAVVHGGLTISPTIRFESTCILNTTIWGNYKMLLKNKRLKAILMDQIKECWIIETPGIFYNHSYVNEDIYSKVKRYKYIEDVIFYSSLITKTDIDVFFDEKPYVMYRMGGISTTKANTKKVEKYNEEQTLLENTLFTRRKWLSKGKVNFYRYFQSVRWRYYMYIIPVISKKVRSYEINRKKELKRAQVYLKKIVDQRNQWEIFHE